MVGGAVITASSGMNPLGPYVRRSGDSISGSLTVKKLVEDKTDGYKFPDGTIQLTAAEADAGELETDVTVLAGQAVYIKGTNSHLALAQANAVATAQPIGLAQADTGPTFSCRFTMNGGMTMTDWTAATGSTNLTPGAVYYLDTATAGQLTKVPPATVGQYVVKVGTAVSASMLNIEIEPGIAL